MSTSRCRGASRTSSASTLAPTWSPASRRRPIATSSATRWTSPPTRQVPEMDKPFAVTLEPGTSRADKTGTWRTERAEYVTRMPPCGNACPAGEDVRGWLFDAEDGEQGYQKAWRTIMETNPFPAVMGRVCYHPCE